MRQYSFVRSTSWDGDNEYDTFYALGDNPLVVFQSERALFLAVLIDAGLVQWTEVVDADSLHAHDLEAICIENNIYVEILDNKGEVE